jgi:hypothetical protein
LEFEIAGMIKEKEGGRDIWISLDLIFHYTGYTALLHTTSKQLKLPGTYIMSHVAFACE